MSRKGVKTGYRTRLDREWLKDYIRPHLVVSGDKECWLWQNSNGNFEKYPRRRIAGTVYRVGALMLWIAGITSEPLEGDRHLLLCHTCDQGYEGCVRPDHIFTGSQVDNMQDCLNKGRNPAAAKEFCVNGHPLNDPLVGRRYKNRAGHRQCLVCKRESEREKNNIPPEKWKGSIVEKLAIDGDKLKEALDICQGYKKDAAKYLGISTSSFFRKWQQAGFDTNVPGTRKRPIRYQRVKITHCKHGHEFTEENTYITSSGRRGCRECQKIWSKERHRPKQEARARKNEEIRLAMTKWKRLYKDGGNRSEGARVVGVSRTSFDRKWEEFFGAGQ